MSQAERISRIHFLLRAKGVVSLEELKETFEVSRATLMRDIELMRDRLGAPVIYDAKENGYRYDAARFGERVDELPGLWLSAKEGYAFLTLFNVLRAIDPGFLMYFLDPMRRTLKRLLTSHDFTMWRLDEKVVIDLPNFSRPTGRILRRPSQPWSRMKLSAFDGKTIAPKSERLIAQSLNSSCRRPAGSWRSNRQVGTSSSSA